MTTSDDDLETAAYRRAIDAFMETYLGELKAETIGRIVSTVHEHNTLILDGAGDAIPIKIVIHFGKQIPRSEIESFIAAEKERAAKFHRDTP